MTTPQRCTTRSANVATVVLPGPCGAVAGLADHQPAADHHGPHTAEAAAGHRLDHASGHKLTDEDKTELRRVLDRCATLRQVDQLVSDFAGMTRHRQGRHLDTWIVQATSSGIPAIAGFADGLLKDYDAVRNGLTLEHSSGAVEGNVNRIKMIKRTMYGRANFDLLRRRVLLAD